jgi:hypothetical protein
MGFAIFFSLAPFSFYTDGKTSHFMITDKPGNAAVYAAIGAVLWVAYAAARRMTRAV